jgi:hypothetical protein
LEVFGCDSERVVLAVLQLCHGWHWLCCHEILFAPHVQMHCRTIAPPLQAGDLFEFWKSENRSRNSGSS